METKLSGSVHMAHSSIINWMIISKEIYEKGIYFVSIILIKVIKENKKLQNIYALQFVL